MADYGLEAYNWIVQHASAIHALMVGYGARVYNSANQSIANVTWTTVSFDSERYDTDAIHDTVTNNSRLTCVTAGKYIIIFSGLFAANATGSRGAAITLNGTTYIANITVAKGQSNEAKWSVSTIYDLAVTDYVEARVYQSSGGNLNLTVESNNSIEFMMQRIG